MLGTAIKMFGTAIKMLGMIIKNIKDNAFILWLVDYIIFAVD